MIDTELEQIRQDCIKNESPIALQDYTPVKKKFKVLNLYSGLGGNRKLWPNDKVEVTAIEIDDDVAEVYKDMYPNDKVVITDAHAYLLEHYQEFDFIWSSPPCPTHSQIRQNLGVLNGLSKPKENILETVLNLKLDFIYLKWLSKILRRC
jgi:16S rRNA A1518/A1519 N6-dimethyltransferase RsmA/KsgA/DIM1 with predicted DNA glycosylase/AP lyase activity